MTTGHGQSRGEAAPPVEVSIVIPCLNEADTLATCVAKAREALQEHGIAGEIIVADNGSTDASPAIALALGVRLVRVAARGYGHALMAGIAAARGKYVIMGDADDSYDFRDVPRFVEKLRAGYDLVQGCRFPVGGGHVMPGAMPRSHRALGNPLFSRMARLMFRAPLHDVYCGLRGFTRSHYQALDLRATGMEFATEMIIKSSLRAARMAEIPITLHPDGRTSHPSHLRTIRDGWRTLRLFLIYSPRWLFLLPGFAFTALGLVGYALAMPGVTLAGATLDAHTLLFASLLLIVGYQTILFAVFATVFATTTGFLPEDRFPARLFGLLAFEKGLVIGAAGVGLGGVLLLVAINQWRLAGFGHLDYAHTMRLVIPGATLTVLGVQTVLSSFLLGLLGMHRR